MHSAPRRIRTCVLLLAATLPCMAGHAHESRGPYVGAALHRATLHFDSPLASGPPDFSTLEFRGRDIAPGLLGGCRLAGWFAAEATYFSARDTGTDPSAARFRALTAVAKGIWPIGALDMYGKVGVSSWKSHVRYDQQSASRHDGVDPVVGLGVQYRIGRFALRADLDTVLLRIVDNFGSAPRDGGSVRVFSAGTVWRLR